MLYTRNAILVVLVIAVATMGYFFYESRQNVVEIKLPSATINGK